MNATTAPASGPRLPPPNEPRLPVSRLAHLFPLGRHGEPPGTRTIDGYVLRGIRGVYLEGGVSAFGTCWSTEDAVERFHAALTRQRLDGEVVNVPTDLERRAAKAIADVQAMRAARHKRRRPKTAG